MGEGVGEGDREEAGGNEGGGVDALHGRGVGGLEGGEEEGS